MRKAPYHFLQNHSPQDSLAIWELPSPVRLNSLVQGEDRVTVFGPGFQLAGQLVEVRDVDGDE